jgi:hypothetical protein
MADTAALVLSIISFVLALVIALFAWKRWFSEQANSACERLLEQSFTFLATVEVNSFKISGIIGYILQEAAARAARSARAYANTALQAANGVLTQAAQAAENAAQTAAREQAAGNAAAAVQAAFEAAHHAGAGKAAAAVILFAVTHETKENFKKLKEETVANVEDALIKSRSSMLVLAKHREDIFPQWERIEREFSEGRNLRNVPNLHFLLQFKVINDIFLNDIIYPCMSIIFYNAEQLTQDDLARLQGYVNGCLTVRTRVNTAKTELSTAYARYKV